MIPEAAARELLDRVGSLGQHDVDARDAYIRRSVKGLQFDIGRLLVGIFIRRLS